MHHQTTRNDCPYIFAPMILLFISGILPSPAAASDFTKAEQAIAAMQRLTKTDQPFFLAAGFIRPHLPFVMPRKYWELYDRDKIPLVANQFFPSKMPAVAFGDRSRGGFYELQVYMDYFNAPSPFESPLTEAQQRELKHGYHASISFIDKQIGRLLAKLDRLDLVEWLDHEAGKTVATELYDHQTDPDENINIADRPECRRP